MLTCWRSSFEILPSLSVSYTLNTTKGLKAQAVNTRKLPKEPQCLHSHSNLETHITLSTNEARAILLAPQTIQNITHSPASSLWSWWCSPGHVGTSWIERGSAQTVESWLSQLRSCQSSYIKVKIAHKWIQVRNYVPLVLQYQHLRSRFRFSKSLCSYICMIRKSLLISEESLDYTCAQWIDSQLRYQHHVFPSAQIS